MREDDPGADIRVDEAELVLEPRVIEPRLRQAGLMSYVAVMSSRVSACSIERERVGCVSWPTRAGGLWFDPGDGELISVRGWFESRSVGGNSVVIIQTEGE